ncbi:MULTISPECIES: hypothetical protein [Stenotrophomonas]|uniref:hypothetical protein n=1 Tax=Stenotrophomonas TaxID=40323 RepID=UPI000D53DA70|nr:MULTISPECIES: hypothetical protein [Stenotrophomonas]AWH23187.1 hypothetical protein C1933_19120 [Stenotrophomonas sp. ZAC14D2_NAIMI4_6]
MSEPEERDELSAPDFYAQYYLDSGFEQETVIELLRHVADELRLPAGKLRSTDRFSKELSPGQLHAWDAGYGVLIVEVQSLARKRGVAIDKRVASLDDYIRIMASIY